MSERGRLLQTLFVFGLMGLATEAQDLPPEILSYADLVYTTATY